MSISSRESREAPGLVGMHDEIVVAFEQAVVEVDHAAARICGGKMRMQP